VGHHRVAGALTAGHLFKASDNIGRRWRSLTQRAPQPETEAQPFTIL